MAEWKTRVQKRNAVQLTELADQIRAVEGIVVGLNGPDKLFEPYRLSRPSPGRMKGREWLVQFEKWYPDIDVVFPSENLTLRELRMRIPE